MRILQLTIAIWLTWYSVGWAAEVTPTRIDQFCIAPDQPEILRWQVGEDLANQRIDAVIRDFEDRVVASPTMPVTVKGQLELSVELPTGFYEIEIPQFSCRFGLIVTPAGIGKPDPFFSIDSAMSWLVQDDATRDGLIQLLARCGIFMSRERLNWARIQPAGDAWNWDGSERYERLRQFYRRTGIPVLEMFHGTTSWAGRVGKYPDDLIGTAGSWRQIIRRFQPTWGAMEVWNEPDISFGDHLPADQYTALVKVFSYLFHEQQVEVPLVGGVFAHYHSRFLDCAARNGLLNQVSIASFHTYDRAASMENLISRYRKWLSEYDHASMPLWLTECGRPWERGPERPPSDQDATSALDIVMKGVESKACGVARYFAFVYPFYEERKSNFGMMGREATPLRSMAGYVQTATALAHKKYIGDLICSDSTIKRARVFANGREAVAVLYTGKPDAKATVKIDFPTQRIQGIDGRTLTPAADGTVPIPDGLVFLYLNRDNLDARLKTDTPAMQLFLLGSQPETKPLGASPIVIRYQFNSSEVLAKTEGYAFNEHPTQPVTLTFRVFNLSATEHARHLTLSASQPVGIDGATTQNIAIPPTGFKDVTWSVDLSRSFEKTGKVTLSVRSVGDSSGQNENVEIDLIGTQTIEQIGRQFPQHNVLPISELSAWRRNMPASGEMTMESADEHVWKMSVRFRDGDRWVYPYYDLPDDVSVDDYDAIALRARCGKKGAVRVFLWEGDTGVGYLSPTLVTGDGKWHVVVGGFDEFNTSSANTPDANRQLDLNLVRRISIGMNSEVNENSLEVSDVLLIKRK